MSTRLGWFGDLQFHTTRTPTAFAASCVLGLMAPSALATPEGGTFVTNPGWGQILQNGPAGQTVTNVFLPGTVVDPSNRHIINWTSLDLGSAETLNFNGEGGYAVMNRIAGLGTATSINGTLNAMTGNVYIVNSAGVVFGQNAVINAAGLHAAAASWSEGDALQTDFLAAAPLTFNTTGDVEFHGTLSGSDGIALIGQHVRNTGDITGRYIVMAAGDRVVVEDLGSRFSVVIDGQAMDDLAATPSAGTVTADLTTGDPGVHNSGTITATGGGNVSLVAGDLLGLAILHDGEIHAEGGDVDLLAAGGAIWTSADNGNIANAGLIDVSDDNQAGTIDLSAAAIVLEASAQANGHAGSISVQGYSNVVLAGGGALVADGGMATADGGDIVVHATNGTVWAEAGTGLSAKGGLFGGDGGRIEVDGQTIALQAATKLGAVAGDAGQLVINSGGPVTIEASGDALVAVDQTDLSTSILAAGDTGRIGAASGETLSSVDGHLELTTAEPLRIETSLLDLRETASFTSDEIRIDISDADQSIHATSLTLDGPVVLEQSVSLGGDDRLTLRGGNVSGDASTTLVLGSGGFLEIEGDLGSEDSKLGNIDLLAGHTMTLLGGSTRAGQYIHTSGNLNIGGMVQGDDATMVSVSAAEAVIVRAGGDITLGADGGSGLSVQVDDNVDIEAGGMFTNLSDFAIDGSLRFAGGDLVNNADLSADQGITMQALTGDLDTVGTLNTVMDINLAAANTLTNDVSITSEQGSVRLESYQSDVVSLAPLNAADIVSLKADNGSVSSTNDVLAADVSMTAGDGITIGGNVTGTSSLVATAGTGNITTNGGGLLQATTLTLNASGGSIEIASNLSGQTLDVNAGNDLTIFGDLTGVSAAATGAGGDITLTSQGGDLAVSGDLGGEDITMTATGGGVTYTGLAVASGDVVITSNGAADITADVTTAGDLMLTSDAGAATYVGTAAVDGNIIINAETDVTLGGQLVAASIEALAMQGDLTHSAVASSGGAITLTAAAGNASLSGTLTGSRVVVNAEGDMTSSGVITSPTDLVALIAGGDVTHTGTITGGSVAIGSEQGGTVTINGSVTASVDLDVLAENDGAIAVGGILRGDAVLLDAANVMLGGADVLSTGGDLLVTADAVSVSGDTTLASAADLTLAASAGGTAIRIDDANLTLSSENDLNLLGSVDGGGDLTAFAGDMLLVGGNIGSAEAVDAINLDADRLVLGDTNWLASELIASGDVLLNDGNLDTLSDLPSVYGFGPTLRIESASGDVTIGGHQGLSYLGDLTLAANGSLTIGDITTLGDLTLRGDRIVVHRRASGTLATPLGDTTSEQTSIVSGGTLRIDGQLSYMGDSDNDPRFAAATDAIGVPDMDRGVTDYFAAADMTVGTLTGDRPTLRSLAGSVQASDEDLIAAESHAAKERPQRLAGNEDIRTTEVLTDLGIELIDPSETANGEDRIAAAGHFVDDLNHRGDTMIDPTSGLVRVSRSRLNSRYVRAAVADYAAAIAEAPEAGSIERAGLIVQEARLEWEAVSGEKPGYRQWLAEGGSPIRDRAARILADFDAVFRDLRLAGLTRAEVEASRRFVDARLGGVGT